MIRTIQHPYQSVYRVLFIGALLMNIPGIVAFIFDAIMITMFAGMAQVMMMVIAVMFYVKGKSDLNKIGQLIYGDILAHWTYETNHWKSYAVAEYKRQKENAISTMVAFFVAGPLLAWIGYKDMTLTDGILIGVVLGLFSLGIGLIYAKSILKRSNDETSDAFIGVSSAYINGIFLDWNAREIAFLGASITNDTESGAPSVLIKYSYRGRHSVQQKEMFIPIPDGKMDDAKNIAERLNSSSLRDHQQSDKGRTNGK